MSAAFDNQSQVNNAHPLCGLCMSADFSRAAGDCRKEGRRVIIRKATCLAWLHMPTSFNSVSGKRSFCVHVLFSVLGQENVTAFCAQPPHPESRG